MNLSVLRHQLQTVIHAALAGAEPGRLLSSALDTPETRRLMASAASIDVLAVGKAARLMLAAADATLSKRWRRALAIAPEAAPQSFARTDWMVAAHPIPDGRSEAAGRAALALASSQGRDDLLLVLMSGGASSLMAVPAEGISLDDKRATSGILLTKGANISEMNVVRKHVSAVKGGGLAVAAPGRVLTLAVSDVVGNDLSTIGSGPAVADTTTFVDALSVLERWGGVSRYPSSVVDHLERGARSDLPETPKAFSADRVMGRVVVSAADALDAAEDAARALGYRVYRVGEPIVGEARLAGQRVLEKALEAARSGRPCCLLAAGETTVRVIGEGTGGRNQELALSMAQGLEKVGPAVAASVGSDGVDGPTDAAGAIVDSTTAERARQRGLDPSRFLADNNSYKFFDVLGDLVRTGPTGTNVGDIQIVMMDVRKAASS